MPLEGNNWDKNAISQTTFMNKLTEKINSPFYQNIHNQILI